MSWPSPGRTNDDVPWYKEAVIYELHVRAFYDGNGDGIGDFKGLTEKLDYLEELGITCIWLLPMYPSPMRDDGYDIADYYNISPDYGTMADFDEFLLEAHSRGLKVMTELVLNHTSDQHPWFQAARQSPDSEFYDYYVWSDTDQMYRDARVIFLDTEKSNWTWDPSIKKYYWHRFFSHQPDLNFDNPKVREAMLQVVKYWLDKGVDGLRCDAVPYLFERDGTNCENLPETHAFVKELRKFIDARYSDRVLLAEANQWPEFVADYFGDGTDEFHMAFHFPLMPRIFMALRRESRIPIVDILAQTPAIPEACQWAIFLRNHDELTLEMVTDSERDYMYFTYALDPRMRLNLGIRRRLAPLLENGRREIELLFSLLLSLPGTPVLYYGDEMGMGDNIYLGDRNGVRTPMQWNADRNGGFSNAPSDSLYAAPVTSPVYGYQTVNVDAQLLVQTSLLHWIKRLISIRKKFRALALGSMRILHAANDKVLAYVRECDQERVLLVCNLSGFAQAVALDLSNYAGQVPVEIFGNDPFPTIRAELYPLTLGPYDVFWFQLSEKPPR